MTTTPLLPRAAAGPAGTLDSSPARQRRRLPIRPAAVLGGLLVAAAAGVLALDSGSGSGPSGPLTPRWAVDAYFATAASGDADAHWDLMCREEQADVGPREEYLRSLDDLARRDPDELFRPSVVGVHPAGPTNQDGFAVDVVLRAADGSGWSDEVLVVWERGGFRLCGVA